MFAFILKNWKLITIPVLILAAAGVYGHIQKLKADRDWAIVQRNDAEAQRDTIQVRYSTDSTVVIGILGTLNSEISKLRKKNDGLTKAAARVKVTPKPQQAVHTDSSARPLPVDLVLKDSIAGPPVDIYTTVLVDSTRSEWAWVTRPWPIPITIDIGCKERLKPDVLVETPTWARVDSVQTRIDPAVCGFDANKKKGHKRWMAAALIVGGFLAGTAVN